MFGIDESRRAQQWRNQAKARYLLQEYGTRALDVVRENVRAAGFNLKIRSHWKRVERHVSALLADDGLAKE